MKTWNIVAGDKSYEIGLKGKDVIINGESYKLKDLPAVKKFYAAEYSLPIEGAQVLLTNGMTSMQLVADGVNLDTGKPYYPLGDLPGWAYAFLVLNAINFLNGAIGAAIAVICIMFTIRVGTNQEWGTGKKIAVSFAILLAAFVIVMCVAFMVASAIY